MNNREYKEDTNNAKAFLYTVIVFIAILAICFFVKLSSPYSFLQNEQEGSIVVNYGLDEQGSGSNYKNNQEISSGTNKTDDDVVKEEKTTDNDDVDKTTNVQEEPPLSKPNSDQKQTILSSDNNKKSETPSFSPAPKKNNKSTVVKEEKKPNPKALYTGKKTNSKEKGDGSDKKPGNKGTVGGNLNEPSYKTGSISGDIVLTLAGRHFEVRPKIEESVQVSGRIAVQIVVNKSGEIIAAKGGVRGTTITDAALWKQCETAVLDAKLNPTGSGPETQVGAIIITFRLK